ncbi:PD40 domain-containing protein [Candidatus Pacearchaeota archaeon]|nr:PD40 domain-containing protein [Candidatus Pacearchaeota archaeon]
MRLENLLRKARSFSRKALRTALVASTLMSTTCSNKPTTPIEPPNDKVKFAENVRILDQPTLDAIDSYDETTGTFTLSTQLYHFNNGEILVGGPSNARPLGFLRKVTYVSHTRDTVKTTQATLAEAIKEGEIKISKRLTPQDIAGYDALSGVAKPTSSESYDFNIPINNVVIYDADRNPSTTNDQVVANGNFSFNYDFNFYADIELPVNLKKLRFENTAKESAELRINSKPYFTINTETTFAKYVFTPVPVLGTPLFVVPIIEVNAGINGEAYAKFSTGFSQSAELYAGIIKENGVWSTPVNFSTDFNFQAPTINGNANLKGYVGPDLSLMIYGVLGGYGEIDVFSRLIANSMQTPKWKLSAGLEAYLGVKDEILGWIDYNAKVIDYEKLLAQDTVTPLFPSLVAKPNSGNAPLEVLLDASGSTGPITDYEFLFDDGSTNYIERRTNAPDGAFDGKTKHTYASSGNYILEVVIGNGQIAYAIAKDTINVSPGVGPTGKIAFTSVRGRDSDVYTINADGTNEKELTFSSSLWEGSPSWSPDGTKIAFGAFPSANANQHNIYVMDNDGNNKVQLTNSEMSEDNPVFSLDGRQIAYGAAWVDGHEQLYIMNADGSNQRQITQDTLCYWDLALSPAGNKIAFYNCRDDNLYSINIDGSGLKKLTNTSAYERNPSWSPDGSEILFTSSRDGNAEVYKMKADGSNQQDISNSPNTHDESPSWSPDGKFIVYASVPKSTAPNENETELWIMKADGTGKKRITNNNYFDWGPKWAPK